MGKNLIPEIEKQLLMLIWVLPINNGDLIIINIPPLTEERRIELSKSPKLKLKTLKYQKCEDANNSIKK